MIKIHGTGPSRSLRLIWLCEEMGLPYQIVPQSLPPNDAYLAINPLGTLPFLEDEGGVGIAESVAGMLYLAEQYGPTPLLPHKGDPDLARILQMTVFGEATLGAWIMPIFGTQFRAPDEEKNNWTMNMARSKFEGGLKYLSDHLGDGPYIAGSRFSLADISVGYAVGICSFVMAADNIPVNLTAYHARLAERPAHQRATAVK